MRLTAIGASQMLRGLDLGSRLQRGVIAVGTVATATLLGIGTSAIATEGMEDAPPGNYLSEADVDRVWALKYNAMLPEFPPGTKVSLSAPDFFHPSEPGTHVFEDGLIDGFMVQTLRCAWIVDGIAARKTSDFDRVQRAEEVLANPSHLEVRDSGGVTFGDYLREGAKNMGSDIRTFELVSECNGNNEEGR